MRSNHSDELVPEHHFLNAPQSLDDNEHTDANKALLATKGDHAKSKSHQKYIIAKEANHHPEDHLLYVQFGGGIQVRRLRIERTPDGVKHYTLMPTNPQDRPRHFYCLEEMFKVCFKEKRARTVNQKPPRAPGATKKAEATAAKPAKTDQED